MALAIQNDYLSVATYLQGERSSETRHEFLSSE